jgi:hypothetical protein
MGRGRQNHPPMEAKAKRTLVKSAPELWELADDLARMEAWMAGLLHAEAPVRIEITDRDPERILAWRCANGEHGQIEIELAESGFGTAVSITAQHAADPAVALDALEQLLDELGSPERRPFTRA